MVTSRRRTPGNLRHETEQVVIARHREELANHAQVLRRVANQIFRRQHGIQRVGPHACLNRILIDRAMDAQQSTNARQHETEADGNGLEPIGRDDHKQGESASGNVRVQQAQRRERGEAFDLQVKCARVLRVLAVEVQEAATVNNFGVDVEADGFRRLEAKIQVEEAEVGIRFDEIGSERESGFVEAGRYWSQPYVRRDADAERQFGFAVVRLRREPQ